MNLEFIQSVMDELAIFHHKKEKQIVEPGSEQLLKILKYSEHVA